MSKSGNVREILVQKKQVEKAMTSLLSYNGLCDKYTMEMQKQGKITKNWSMEQINC